MSDQSGRRAVVSGQEVEWVDDGDVATTDEELVVAKRWSMRMRVRLALAVAAVAAIGIGWLGANRPAHHAPLASRPVTRPVSPTAREVPLTSALIPTGTSGRSSRPGVSEEYRLSLQNISAHPLGPIGEIQLLFPGRLNGSVASTEIIPDVDPAASPGDGTPAPLSIIRPGQEVQLLVSFSWFCPDVPVQRPRTGVTTLRVQLAMAAFRDPGVYELDGGAAEDAFSVYRADCAPR
jgi:hypothetical protein